MRDRSRTRWLILAAAAVLGVALATWMVTVNGAQQALRVDVDVARVPTGTSGLHPLTPKPGKETSVWNGPRADAGAGVPASLALPPEESAVPQGFQRVRVVTGRDRRAVVGAQVDLVGFRREGRSDEAQRSLAFHQQLEILISGVTDDRGLWHFERRDDVQAVQAAGEGRWALSSIESSVLGEEIMLELLRDQSVDVLVEDAGDSSPRAGVDVGLWYGFDGGSRSLLDTVTTDATGRARFEHVQDHLGAFWPHTESLSVEAIGMLAPPASIELDPWATHQSAVLALPPTAAIEVLVLASDGRPVEQTLSVVLFLPVGENEEEYDLPDRYVESFTERGRARLGGLVVDQEFEIAVQLRQAQGAFLVHKRVRSPAVGGGTLGVELRLDEDPGQVKLRLESPDGEPVARTEVRVGERLRFRTDAEGSLCVNSVEVGAPGRALHLKIQVDAPGTGWGVSVEVPTLPETGTLDLGTLRMEDLGTLAAGQVVDAAGRPVSGVVVEAYSQAPDQGRWRQRPKREARCRTLSDGTFVLEGRCTLPTIQLHLSSSKFQRRYVSSVAVGASSLQIRLDGAGEIEGSVLLSEAWMRDFCLVNARPRGSAGWTESTSLDHHGRFEFPSLAPGSWEVSVRMDGDPEPAIVVPDLQVEAGQVLLDPRLDGIDLRATGRLLEFFVESTEGVPILDGELLARAAGTSVWETVSWFEEGRAQLFTTMARADVVVQAEGWRQAQFLDVRNGDRIQLQPAPELAICWRTGSPVLRSGCNVSMDFEIEDDGLPETSFGTRVGDGPDDPDYQPFFGGRRLKTEIAVFTKHANGDVERLGGASVTRALDDRAQRQVVELEWPQALERLLEEVSPSPEDPGEGAGENDDGD